MSKIDVFQFPSTADYDLIDLFSITSFIKISSSSLICLSKLKISFNFVYGFVVFARSCSVN